MVKTIDSEWLKNELLDMQRWEDEGGGQMIESNAPVPDRLLIPPVPIDTERHETSTSLQWNERLVIEPFQPGHARFLIRKKLATKTD